MCIEFILQTDDIDNLISAVQMLSIALILV